MSQSSRNLLKIMPLAGLLAVFIAGCGGGGELEETATPGIQMEEVPPGALPDVPAELGGAGFTGEGWSTNMDEEPIGDPRAKKGGSFSWAIPEFPATLRIIGKDSNSWFNRIMEVMTYESLMGIHSNTLKFVPVLATHWKISDDKLTYWFRINPDARWADGSRVSSEDVLWSWKLRVDPGILFPSTNVTYDKYEEPVAQSPYIVRVTAKEMNWRLFIYFGGMSIFPAKYIKDLPGGDYLKRYQFELLPGSGPYTLKSEDVIKGRSITMTRRTDWWAVNDPANVGTANFDRVKFVEVTEERLRFEKFKKGELDYYIVGRAQWWVEETDFGNVTRGLVQKRKVYNDEPQGYAGIIFNMRKPPFDDPRMRMAFTFLFNREKLIEQLFFKEYLFLDSYYPGGIYENPDNPKYRYDPDRAVALLKESGWAQRNREGWLVNAKGESLELDLPFIEGWDRIFTVLQEDLKSVGIKLNLQQTTQATDFKMAMERKFQIHFQSWSGLLFPNPETSWWSKLADTTYTNNLSGVKDERIDKLLERYDVAFDQEERIDIIREIDGILMEIQPTALGWFAPFTRMLYWNKFDYPEYCIPRISRYYEVVPLIWWFDAEKDKRLQKAKKDRSTQLEVGKTEITYWPEWNLKHGRVFKGEL